MVYLLHYAQPACLQYIFACAMRLETAERTRLWKDLCAAKSNASRMLGLDKNRENSRGGRRRNLTQIFEPRRGQQTHEVWLQVAAVLPSPRPGSRVEP